jgi:cytochrome P450
MVLAGGIETVAGALSTTVWYLAQKEAHRRQLFETQYQIGDSRNWEIDQNGVSIVQPSTALQQKRAINGDMKLWANL